MYEAFVIIFGMAIGSIITLWAYANSDARIVYREHNEAIAKCEAELPRNKTCTAKIIAEVAE